MSILHVLSTLSSDSYEGVHPIIYRVYVICPTCGRNNIYYKYEREFSGGSCPKECAYCKCALPMISAMLPDNGDLALSHKVSFYGG